MANTTQDKLQLLLQSKSRIRNSIIEAGSDMPFDTPLKDYPNFITGLSQFVETTSLADLMTIVDYAIELNSGLFKDHQYTEEEQTNLMNLVNLIVEGGTE